MSSLVTQPDTTFPKVGLQMKRKQVPPATPQTRVRVARSVYVLGGLYGIQHPLLLTVRRELQVSDI